MNKDQKDTPKDDFSQEMSHIVMMEWWELQEQRLKNKHLGLNAFLNKHFPKKLAQDDD